MIKTLYQHGADINAKNLNQETIVEIALSLTLLPKWKLAHFLLKKNRCDINAFVDTDNNTLLHKAVVQSSSSVISFLLERGANPDARNKYGISPLQIVEFAQNKNETILRLLKEVRDYGGLVDCIIPNDNGDTPLHCAVNKRDCEEIESLISKRADLTVKNNQELTAFDLALQSKDAKIIECFTRKFIFTFLYIDSYMFTYKKFKKFFLDNFGINRSIQSGATLLLLAASIGNYDKCAALLKLGADINQANINGRTPLFEALIGMNYSVSLLLLEQNAVVTKKLTNWDFAPQYVQKKIIEKYDQQTNSKK